MKTKQFFLSSAILIMALSLSFTGCRPNKDKDKDKDTSGAEDNTIADKSFEDIGQISNEAASGGLSSYKLADYDGLLSHCVTVTHDTALNKITVDFGSANCLCHDNRYRRGKLFITYTNSVKPEPYTYWDSLTKITITTTPDNSYFVGNDASNMHQVIGTKNITNNGHNAAGHMTWIVDVNGQIVKPNNQGTITWTSNRVREWLTGEGTPSWQDDSYGVTGTASGTSANGTPFSMNITSQLIRKINCIRWFVSGTLEFKPGNKPTRYVDFAPPSNGACDDEVWVTINSTVYKIHMH